MRLIQYLAIFSLWLMSHTDGVSQYIPNEYILYLSNGTTAADVANIANTWDSDVISSFTSGQNVAVLKFNGSFPFKNPYNPRQQFGSVIEVVGHIIKHEPGGDGGALNHYVGEAVPGQFGNTCYDQSMLEDESGQANAVSVGVFDSGTNWELANSNGFDFGIAHEVNGDANDNNGHGTHVSSIVNGVYLNSNGGVNTDDVFYIFGNPLSNNGTGTLADVVLSMQSAIAHGVNVINCSFSYLAPTMQPSNSQGPPPSVEFQMAGGYAGMLTFEDDPLYLLMASADPTKTLFVVSAGNDDGRDLDELTPLNVYPAAFPLENMITVASHDCEYGISDFSNIGSSSVDLAAPGENIVSIDHEMNMVSYSGTSQSAAYVSGTASVLGTHLPVFDAAKVKCAILSGAKYSSILEGKVMTSSVLNVPASVDYLLEYGCGPLSRLAAQPHDNVKVFPTMVEDVVNIDMEVTHSTKVEIDLYSFDGSFIQHFDKKAEAGTNQFVLNLDNLGIQHGFLLSMRSNDFSYTSKHFVFN